MHRGRRSRAPPPARSERPARRGGRDGARRHHGGASFQRSECVRSQWPSLGLARARGGCRAPGTRWARCQCTRGPSFVRVAASPAMRDRDLRSAWSHVQRPCTEAVAICGLASVIFTDITPGGLASGTSHGPWLAHHAGCPVEIGVSRCDSAVPASWCHRRAGATVSWREESEMGRLGCWGTWLLGYLALGVALAVPWARRSQRVDAC